MGIVNIETIKDYEYYLTKYPDHLVMFSGHNCPACVTVEPIFRAMAAENVRKVFFVVDYDKIKFAPLFQANPLTALPTFFRNRGGANIDKFVGADPERIKYMLTL